MEKCARFFYFQVNFSELNNSYYKPMANFTSPQSMIKKTNENGNSVLKTIIGKSKTGNRNKWGEVEWQKPVFPLIKDAIFKDNIVEYWKDKLSNEQYSVLRAKGTEAPFSGALLENKEEGVYKCAACEVKLFGSDSKYDSKSGWPSFTEVLDKANVDLREDKTLGMVRTEVTCSNCGGHLGHVFPDGPGDDGARYCINSVSLDFEGQQ